MFNVGDHVGYVFNRSLRLVIVRLDPDSVVVINAEGETFNLRNSYVVRLQTNNYLKDLADIVCESR